MNSFAPTKELAVPGHCGGPLARVRLSSSNTGPLFLPKRRSVRLAPRLVALGLAGGQARGLCEPLRKDDWKLRRFQSNRQGAWAHARGPGRIRYFSVKTMTAADRGVWTAVVGSGGGVGGV